RWATVGTLAPACAAATIWYRRCNRAGNFRSRSFSRRTRRSHRLSGRSRPLNWVPCRPPPMPPPPEARIAKPEGGSPLEPHEFALGKAVRLVRLCRSDLRRAHGFRHPREDGHALAAAAGRERLAGVSVATVDVLPVVHHPHVPGRPDREIGLHLESAAH